MPLYISLLQKGLRIIIEHDAVILYNIEGCLICDRERFASSGRSAGDLFEAADDVMMMERADGFWRSDASTLKTLLSFRAPCLCFCRENIAFNMIDTEHQSLTSNLLKAIQFKAPQSLPHLNMMMSHLVH